MASDQRTAYYPYGYRPIQQPRVSQSLPDKERLRAATRRQNLKSMKSYKVLLIGESGVGKSTLVARLCEDRFMADSRQYTLGFDMFEKEVDIDGERVKVYIWDTVGTETYDSITTSYYRGGAGIIVVYDITALRSFEQLKKWMGYVQMHATEGVNLMLLGAKLDLEARREINADEGRMFAENYDIKFFYEVSAKTGENVNEAFLAFFREVHKKEGPSPETTASTTTTNAKRPCC